MGSSILFTDDDKHGNHSVNSIIDDSVMSSPLSKLNCKWCLWAHLPHDVSWTMDSYIKIMSFSSAEEAIVLFETIPPEMVMNCMLFIMRDGIRPMWEDSKNKKGGCFSYKVHNKSVHSVWKYLSYSLAGESLSKDGGVNSVINGITISPKKNFCIIKIWLSVCTYQNPDVITENNYITNQGCLFKTHLQK